MRKPSQSKLLPEQKADLTPVFQSQLPEDNHYLVSYEALGEEDHPVMITQGEFMRRMKDMSELSGTAGMHGNTPDSYNLVVNENHPLIARIIEKTESKLGEKVKNLREQKNKLSEERSPLEKATEGKNTNA